MVLLPRGFVPYAKAEAIAVGQCNRSQLSATLMSDGGALPHPGRLSRVEFPVALFDAASPLVPGDDDANMVRASALACSGDFLLRFAGCQGKDLIPQRRRAALASRFSGCSALAPTSSRWSGGLCFRGRHFG